MKSHVFWFSSIMFVLLCIEACSPLDFVNETPDCYSEELATATKGSNASDIFYYYFGEKIFLQEREDMLFLKFVDNESRELFLKEILNGISLLKVYNPSGELQFESPDSSDILILESGAGAITDDYLAELSNREDVVLASRILEYQGRFMARNNVFAAKLKSTSDLRVLEDLAAQYGCVVWRYEWTGENVYYLNLSKGSEWDAITLSNLFFETGLFEFSSPDFYVRVALCSSDTYYAYQWGLKNTGQYNNTSGKDINVEAAWSITEGSSNITIAVIDQGVELAHPDLAANIVSGYDAITDTSPAGGPVYNWESHGTAVAGIIGAIKDNGIGIAGVAPGCNIMPIRVDLDYYNINYTQLASAFDWARTHGADVINCSWGDIAPNYTLTTAITDALTLGRNGKGCVVVYSSGNENGTIPYPANLGGVLTVGAIAYDGLRKDTNFWTLDLWGSNYGPELNLAAPGVMIPTTTINSAYTTGFVGTSAAAPHVSGVAGLILSQYPDLTQVQVKRAMERSADRPSSYTYVTDYQYPSGRRCDQVGYGIVDAYGALNVASQIHQQNIIDALSGFDVTITNNTSYTIDDISVELYGTIGGSTVTLFSENMEPVDGGGHMVGYPVYRGAELYATPGATISNISLEFYASCSACPDNLRIAVEIDNSTPTNFESFYFGDGDFYVRSIPNSTVPNASRRRLYIYILNS